MKLFKLTAYAILVAAIGCGDSEPAGETIPLESVWGYHLPETKDVRDLEPVSYGRDADKTPEGLADFLSSKVQEILKSLADREHPTPAGPGFLVVGEDKQALKAAHAVLVEGKKPLASLLTGKNLTLVFYTDLSGAYVEIESILKTDDRISLSYRFNQHMTNDSSKHFALIPIGPIAPGPGRVTVARLLPDCMEGSDAAKNAPDHYQSVVCRSFTYDTSP